MVGLVHFWLVEDLVWHWLHILWGMGWLVNWLSGRFLNYLLWWSLNYFMLLERSILRYNRLLLLDLLFKITYHRFKLFLTLFNLTSKNRTGILTLVKLAHSRQVDLTCQEHLAFLMAGSCLLLLGPKKDGLTEGLLG